MSGPAFPTPTRETRDGSMWSDGMTLRDYFAAKALPVVPEQSAYNMRPREEWGDYTARRAYELADAMMKARGV